MGPIKIHITDDHAVFRHGLKAFIEKESDLLVVSESADGAGTLEQVEATKPDVLLLDINIPGMPASTLAHQLVEKYPKLAILVLTIHDEEHYLREFLRLGAKGFMVKTSTGTELIAAIRKVYAGDQYVDPAMARYLISNYIGRTRRPKDGLELP